MLTRKTRADARAFTASVIVTRKGLGCGPYWSKVDKALTRLRARKPKPAESQSHAEAMFDMDAGIKAQFGRA